MSFGAAPAASSALTVAPTTSALATTTTPAAAAAPAAAVPAPPADCRNKSVEEIINGWKKSLESDCAAFQLQAEKLRSWENEIRSSQAEIVEVSSYAEKLVISQQRTEKVLTEVRKDGSLWWLRPDGKTQVTIEYLQHSDGSVTPKMIHTVVISTQHAEPLKAKRTEEQNGKDFRGAYTGPEQVAPSMADMNEAIHEHVVLATLKSITLKNGKPATSIYDRKTCNLHINPSGKFIIGGPQGDAGLTGRKIIIDTYGGWGAHGGGAFSGKDPTKVDRSAAYACRWMAKSVVKAGLCKRACVQLSYAIGVAKPLSLFVETYGTENGDLSAKAITDIVKMNFDARPGALARDLDLRQPKYNVTAAYCHFGREPYTKDGIRYFAWEDAIDLSKYATMSAADVDKAVAANKAKILAKWVD